jgi:HD-GYP domain-containing protein (c-di-GMP phosphodiesterase class II)
VFDQQLQGFLQQIGPLLQESGEAVLVAIEDDLYLNNTRVPIRSRNARFHQHVLEEFKKREIAGFRVQQGVTKAELVQFFRLFLQPHQYKGLELLTACLAQGTDHVLPAIHASTETPDGLESESAGPTDAAETGPAGGGGSGEGGGTGDGGWGWGSGSAGPEYSAPRGAGRKSYSLAVQGARSLLAATSLQGGMELRHAKRVVQPLVDGAFASEPVVVGLSSLTHHDEYTYAHAVNVCLVSVSMGYFLEMDRRALADLGVAALLHDVGKAAVADLIQHPLERFTPEEQTLAARHPLEGAKLLAKSTTLNQTTLRCMRVALEHHAGPGPDGYPALGAGWQTSLLSRIVAVADCYVSLQTHRSARGASVTPHQALGMMLGPLRSRFHPAMLWALVQTIGFYPTGQLVELDDGSLAVVLAPNANDPARPHLKLLFSPTRERLKAEAAVELRPLPPERSVRRALRGEEYPTEPGTQEAA